MSIKASERLAIISEYIKTGSCRDGYSISETKDGKYRIRRVASEHDKLIAKRDKLRKQLESIESEIARAVGGLRPSSHLTSPVGTQSRSQSPSEKTNPVEQLDIDVSEAV